MYINNSFLQQQYLVPGSRSSVFTICHVKERTLQTTHNQVSGIHYRMDNYLHFSMTRVNLIRIPDYYGGVPEGF